MFWGVLGLLELSMWVKDFFKHFKENRKMPGYGVREMVNTDSLPWSFLIWILFFPFLS